MTIDKYPLLITLALLAITGGLLVSNKNNTLTNLNPQLTTSEAGFNDIVINARGTNGKEKIALYINNTPVEFWNLTNTFQDYTFAPNGEIIVSELSVHFLNDTWEPENNINYDVQIPFITVNGTTYNSEHPSTVSTGSWDQDAWCAPGNKQTQWLHCTGSFTYNITVGTIVGLPNTDPNPICGNDAEEQGETCDDGNVVGGDECSSECQDESIESLPLFQITDMTYKGAFRVDGGTHGGSRANYSVGTLAYNPDRNSLYIAGHPGEDQIGEFAIPALKKTDAVIDLNESQNISPFRSIKPEDKTNRTTGMLYKDGQLVVNAEISYDASGTNVNTTFVLRDTENFATSDVDGYFQLDGAAHASGYMSPIPAQWQSQLGSAHLTGWSNVYSILNRYSVGPSLFSFDINDVLDRGAKGGAVTTTAHMDYFLANDRTIDPGSMGRQPGSASAIWNHLTKGIYGFIVPGTRTFVVLGSSAGVDSGIGYKITQDTGRLCAGYCTYEASDTYNYYWLFDLDAVLAAENTWDPRPYDYGKLFVPFDRGDDGGLHRLSGATFDPESETLYVHLEEAGQVGRYNYPPVIVVYDLSQ